MYSVTYVGTDTDRSESVTIDGHTYKLDKAVKMDEVHSEIEGNPTFEVSEVEEKPEVEEKTEEAKPVAKPRARKTTEKADK